MSVIRIATRGSALALAQADWVAGRIKAVLGVDTEQLVVKTTGDRVIDQPLAKIGGKGLFIKEIEEALFEDRADVAVHSAKDLPAEIPEAMRLVAFPQRLDPRDALVLREGTGSLDSLGPGARVGTGSVRRTALLRAYRPDLQIVPLRGNVPTRLSKLEDGNMEAIVLAAAGLERLGLADRIGENLSPDTMLPAVCQGALALEVKIGSPFEEPLRRLNDPRAALSIAAERAFLGALEGDCSVPLAGLCEFSSEGDLRLRGLVASIAGDCVVRSERRAAADADAAASAGRDLALEILDAGGAGVLAALQAGGPG